MSVFTTQTVAGAGLDVRSLENPSTPVDAVWDDTPAADMPVRVTPTTAVTMAAVWQAVNVLSGDVAQLPVKIYRRLSGDSKDTDRSHPAWRLLHRRPHRDFGPFQFKQWMMYHALLRGNAYARIRRVGGVSVELVPLEPWTVTPELVSGELVYRYYSADGGSETYQPGEMLHLRGPGGDVLCGQSVIGIARDSLSVGMAAQRYGERYFANDARPGIAIEVGEKVGPEAAANTLKHWDRRHAGSHNARRTALLDNGSKLHTYSMSNEDAQFLSTREFSRSEVASWFNLPPHKVGDLTRATFSNIEQQSIDYVVYSLMPWLVRWQDECNAKLFTEEEIAADSHFCEFEVAALLRGDFQGRTDGYASAIQSGWMTRNEVRAKENLNPIDGLSEPLSPLNMAPAGEAGDSDPLEPPEDDDEDGGDSRQALRGVFEWALGQALQRSWQRTLSHAAKAAKTHGDLHTWWTVCAADERAHALGQVAPIMGRAILAGVARKDTRADEDSVADAFARDAGAAIARELDAPEGGLKMRLNRLAGQCPLDASNFLEVQDGKTV